MIAWTEALSTLFWKPLDLIKYGLIGLDDASWTVVISAP